MRLWSIHPKYLDSIGLIACWRETLLAKKVLLNLTKGYKNHPQLLRFKNSSSPIDYINFYLNELYIESKNRNYNFNYKKISGFKKNLKKIKITNKQIEYEFSHLMKKLKTRSVKKYNELKKVDIIETNNLFKIIPGKIENWEIKK